jgi:hypothetical protein
MGLTDSVVVLEIEIWIRIRCLEAVVRDWGFGKIQMYHLLEQWDLTLVEIRSAHVAHLSPPVAPFFDQVLYLLVASLLLPH